MAIMKYDFVVIGATGMQGRIVTRDLLLNNYSVILCGRDKSRVLDLLNKHKKKTSFAYLDLRDREKSISTIKNSGAKIVVNCADGDWNLNALEICTAANVHSIDLGTGIMSMLRKQLAMKKTLAKKGLIHITG